MLNKGLTLAIENNTISHAYIFFDEDEAFEFAKALKPLAADFIIQEDLLTKDIEGMQAILKIKSFGDRRVVLIRNADNMQPVVQNKLLKTLEEPLGNTVIILSAKRRDAFLPTILSRCTEIASSDKELLLQSESLELAKEFLKAEAFYNKKNIVSEIDNKEDANAFLDALESLLRERLLETLNSKIIGKQIRLIEETRKNIGSGYSVSFALKSLSLDF